MSVEEPGDLSPIAELINLETIYYWGSGDPVPDLSPLTNLPKLVKIDIRGGGKVDLSPLAELTAVKELWLPNCGISNLSFLEKLTSLERLNLESNNISDVSPLAKLTNLKWLDLRENAISDFSPLARLAETASISRVFNPGAPIGGPKIEGPWLWVTVPGERLEDSTDLLAEVSSGIVTEHRLATLGATEGMLVGNNVWTAHKIESVGRNNINQMFESLGIQPDENNRVVYGSIILNSLRKQNTNMFVGSDDAVKVWLNGELVHQKLVWRETNDYQDFFPVPLKQGANVLLVAIDNRPGSGSNWSGFFGFEEGTEYTVIPPGVGFTFSATETNLLAGDTFTLHLNAENITDLAGWQADITFDPAVLEATEVNEGDFLNTDKGTTFFQEGTIDNTAGKITGISAALISESGVSGTGTLLSVTFIAKAGGETQVTLENFEFGSITGAIIPSAPIEITITVGDYPAWDVNQDGRVSILDLILVAKDLGAGTPANLRTDVNRDGTINIQDLIIVAQHLGESTASAAPSVIAIDNGELTPTMIQAWIAQAQIEDDGSIAFQQGIANLKRLLALFIPEETALLHNYPNPFNPETWIPYQLSEPAEVTLTIHSVNGTLIRTLALGHQPAGIYQTRNRAVYWDGKNEVGESVASGIYFYTLTAGDFNATRKMLIRK